MVKANKGVAGRRSAGKKLKIKKETIRDLSLKGRANEVKGGAPITNGQTMVGCCVRQT